MSAEFYEPFLDLTHLNDRGSKKWVAMMLPEHVALIRQYKEEINRDPKPELDEWDYDAIQENIQIALKSKADIKIKRWKDGKFIYNRGFVEGVDLYRREIEIQDPFYLLRLNLDEIVDITIMN